MAMCGVTEHRLGVEGDDVNRATVGGGLLHEVHAYISQFPHESDELMMRAPATGNIAAGDHVRLQGLSTPGMNDLVGVVVEERLQGKVLESSGRWAVHLPPSAGSRTVAIKHQHLVVVPHRRGKQPQSLSVSGKVFEYIEQVLFTGDPLSAGGGISGPEHLCDNISYTKQKHNVAM